MNAPHASKTYYGFYIVAACFFVLFMCWGMVLNTFPIFLKPITESMNWGRGAFSVALLMGAIGTAVTAPIAGVLVDRMGARLVMAVGAAVIGIGLLVASRITELWQLYAAFGVIGCGLMTATIIPCSLVISNWFVSRRGLAMSLAFVGTSVGGMVMSPVANWIILNWGWRVAFLLSGVEILVLVVPVVLLVIRTRPQEMGLEPYVGGEGGAGTVDDTWGLTVKEAFSVPAFWQIATLMLVIGLVTMGVGNHCPAYLTDLGHSETSAAFAWSLVMGAMVLGKLCFGPLADRWSPKAAMIVACALFAVSVVILTQAQAYWVVLLFASVYGFACGAPLVINPLLTSGYLGMRNFGAIYGVLNLMSTVGGAVGPVGTGVFFDSQGTYLPVFYFFFAVMVAMVAVAMTMKSAPRRTGATEQVEPVGVTT